jgi:hypothetical protein
MHVLGERFFKFLVFGRGSFLDLDFNIREKKRFDVSRILMKTPMPISFNCNV